MELFYITNPSRLQCPAKPAKARLLPSGLDIERVQAVFRLGPLQRRHGRGLPADLPNDERVSGVQVQAVDAEVRVENQAPGVEG